MEHKDYIPFVQDYLIAQKVTGKVTFGSTEGDNKGQYWSYEFKNGELTQDAGLLKDLVKRGSNKKVKAAAKTPSNSTFLTGKNIVITGKLVNGTRAEWEARLAAHGATIRSKVSKDTNLLITNEEDSGSEKAMTAKQFGTPVMNETAVENLIKLFS
jgi:NAD-dependent DNA ligase